MRVSQRRRIVGLVPADFPQRDWTAVNGFVNLDPMDWQIVYYGDNVQEAILAFSPGLQACYIHLTEHLLTCGPGPGVPHTRAMGQGLFESRLMAREATGRVYFCNEPDRRILILHAFVEESAKTPAEELKLSARPMKEAQTDDDA